MELKNYLPKKDLSNLLKKLEWFNSALTETILNAEVFYNWFTWLKYIDQEWILIKYKKHYDATWLSALEKVKLYKILDKINLSV